MLILSDILVWLCFLVLGFFLAWGVKFLIFLKSYSDFTTVKKHNNKLTRKKRKHLILVF